MAFIRYAPDGRLPDSFPVAIIKYSDQNDLRKESVTWPMVPGYIQHCRDDTSEGAREVWSADVVVSVLLLKRDTMTVMQSIQLGACLWL